MKRASASEGLPRRVRRRPTRVLWGVAAMGALGLVLEAGAGVAADRSPRQANATHELYYPGRDCRSRVLEVEVFQEVDETWRPHPAHPRVAAESCVAEEPGIPPHQIRIRCIDPARRETPAPWRVGLGKAAGSESPCEDRRPDADGAGILISTPKPESEVSNSEGAVTVVGRVGFGEREAVGYEIVVVVDVSGSTSQPAGLDVDGDGIVGVPLGRPPAITSSDAGDSILAAEIRAVRLLLERMRESLGPTRVAILSFAGEFVVEEGGGAYAKQPAVRVEIPLTASWEALSDGLERILARGPSGGTNFFAAVEASLRELSGHWSAQSDARKGALKIIVFLTDGVPSPPPPGSAYTDPASRARAIMATRGAEDAGVAIHIYALGGRAEEFPKFVRALLHGSAGSFTRVTRPGDTAAFLQELNFSSVSEVSIENLTNATASQDVRLTPDGHFQGEVALVPGENTLRVRAVSTDGSQRRSEFRLRYVNPNERARFLEEERRRMDQLRERRKEVRIEAHRPTAPEETGAPTGDPEPPSSP